MARRAFEVIIEGPEAGRVDAELLERELGRVDRDLSVRVLEGVPTGEDLATMRALAHPLRRRILEALREPRRPRLSPMMLSRTLDENIGNVSYHVKNLAAAGVIEPAGQRQVRGAIEHFYRLRRSEPS